MGKQITITIQLQQRNNTGFGSTTKGLFTWREENPSTRNILEGGTIRWVLQQKFKSVLRLLEKVREGIKNGGRQKQKCNLGPSALFVSFLTTF